MAKKKDFNGVVEESFLDGYESEPTTTTRDEQVPEQDVKQDVEEPKRPEISEKDLKEIWEKKDKRTPEESALFLEALAANDEKAKNVVLQFAERSTYYITDVERECIDNLAYITKTKKNDIVKAALNAYFSDDQKQAAKERVLQLALEKLEGQASKDN